MKINAARQFNGRSKFGWCLIVVAGAITLLGGHAHALTNGKWNATVSCGPREDVSPVRPAFKAELPQLTISKQKFTLPRTYKEPKNTVTEEWRGQVTGGSLTITAKSQRDNGNVWSYELKGPNTSEGTVQLQGSMLDENGKQIRSCSLNLALVEAETMPAPLAATPAKQSAPSQQTTTSPQAPQPTPTTTNRLASPTPTAAVAPISKSEPVGKASFECGKAVTCV